MDECRVCHAKGNFDCIKAKEMFIGIREVFPYLLCQECGSLFIQEFPSNLDKFYSKYPVIDFSLIGMSYWKQFLRRYIILNQTIFSKIFLNFLNAWEDLAFKSLYGIGLKKHMRILDVGCGSGILVKMLNHFGFHDVTGVDPYLKQSIEIPGFRLLKKNICDIQEQFDVVMCHHSFEHVDDVYNTAKTLDKLTKPGGKLIIRMPNIESYSFLRYRECWHAIHAPFHIVLPSSKGMQRIFQETGLQLKERRQEQLVELFLYNINCSLNIALMEPLGVVSFLGDGPIGRKIPPLFTKKEISHLKAKSKAVTKSNMSEYIAYYYEKAL